MIDLISQFATTLLLYRDHEGALYSDDTHRVLLDVTERENARFNSQTLIGSEWVPMGSIEVETYDRQFWHNVVIALIVYRHQDRTMFNVELMVGSFLQAHDGASEFTKTKDRPAAPEVKKAPLRAEKSHKGKIEGTVRSKGKTVTRKEAADEPDILGDS